jgi:hypothetical protein
MASRICVHCRPIRVRSRPPSEDRARSAPYPSAAPASQRLRVGQLFVPFVTFVVPPASLRLGVKQFP